MDRVVVWDFWNINSINQFFQLWKIGQPGTGTKEPKWWKAATAWKFVGKIWGALGHLKLKGPPFQASNSSITPPPRPRLGPTKTWTSVLVGVPPRASYSRQLICLFPKMVGFPNKPMGFPTKNGPFGSVLGVPPFKETPKIGSPKTDL